MFRKRTGIVAFLIFFLAATALSTAAASGDYKLGPGDVLSIGVFGYEELQVKEVVIRPDGKMSFPLAGEVTAAGLSAAELTSSLTVSLGEYLKDPKVVVNVLKFRTTRVYVLGEVNQPGLYELEKSHNLLDAVGIAKGYNKDAAKKKVFVIRKDKPGEPLKVNLKDILTKGDLSQNVTLNEGDVVYLSSNNKIDFAKDILPLLSGAYYITHFDDN